MSGGLRLERPLGGQIPCVGLGGGGGCGGAAAGSAAPVAIESWESSGQSPPHSPGIIKATPAWSVSRADASSTSGWFLRHRVATWRGDVMTSTCGITTAKPPCPPLWLWGQPLERSRGDACSPSPCRVKAPRGVSRGAFMAPMKCDQHQHLQSMSCCDQEGPAPTLFSTIPQQHSCHRHTALPPQAALPCVGDYTRHQPC